MIEFEELLCSGVGILPLKVVTFIYVNDILY